MIQVDRRTEIALTKWGILRVSYFLGRSETAYKKTTSFHWRWFLAQLAGQIGLDYRVLVTCLKILSYGSLSFLFATINTPIYAIFAGAITLDDTDVNSASGATSVVVSLTVGASANKIIFQPVTWGNNRTPSNADFNGDAGTRITEAAVDNSTGTNHAEIWYLDNPDIGTFNATLTMPGTCDGVNLAVTSLIGAATGHDSANEAQGNASDGKTTSITTIADQCWIFDTISDGSGAMTPGASQNSTMNEDGGTSRASYKSNVSAGSNSMAWTWTGSEEYAHAVAAFAPTGGGQPTIKRVQTIPHLAGSLRQKRF